ncbi:T9SS type A sorting domain-containing protein [Dethiothermospora halolimnae]|uniref:T9SS type A sorting domain-containing protein n=1 Tax=Dethiothermospora halolimnae TaxID=3114390 RepID=UPI003CCBC18B
MKKFISLFIVCLLFLTASNVYGNQNLWESEPNNDFRTADTIGANRWKKGTITSKDSSDDYYEYHHEGGKCTFILTNMPFECDYDIYVYNEYGNRIGYDESSNKVMNSVTFNDLSRGVYFVKIKSASGTSQSSYEVSVTI